MPGGRTSEVEVELRLMEVRESLRKVEAGPFTLGTTLDSSHQEQHTVSGSTAPASHSKGSVVSG